mmetsp:Transcript_35197/g.110589  ORF Transcript_35197/g.110589 Transcript_35197/m.110589 type:complete len:428 (-) Transcript_35197:334-1617(-)
MARAVHLDAERDAAPLHEPVKRVAARQPHLLLGPRVEGSERLANAALNLGLSRARRSKGGGGLGEQRRRRQPVAPPPLLLAPEAPLVQLAEALVRQLGRARVEPAAEPACKPRRAARASLPVSSHVQDRQRPSRGRQAARVKLCVPRHRLRRDGVEQRGGGVVCRRKRPRRIRQPLRAELADTRRELAGDGIEEGRCQPAGRRVRPGRHRQPLRAELADARRRLARNGVKQLRRLVPRRRKGPREVAQLLRLECRFRRDPALCPQPRHHLRLDAAEQRRRRMRGCRKRPRRVGERLSRHSAVLRRGVSSGAGDVCSAVRSARLAREGGQPRRRLTRDGVEQLRRLVPRRRKGPRQVGEGLLAALAEERRGAGARGDRVEERGRRVRRRRECPRRDRVVSGVEAVRLPLCLTGERVKEGGRSAASLCV